MCQRLFLSSRVSPRLWFWPQIIKHKIFIDEIYSKQGSFLFFSYVKSQNFAQVQNMLKLNKYFVYDLNEVGRSPRLFFSFSFFSVSRVTQPKAQKHPLLTPSSILLFSRLPSSF